jgi:hypothetical protein
MNRGTRNNMQLTQVSNKFRFVFKLGQGMCLGAMNLDFHSYRLGCI